ncbi:hypothetical protein F4780DRAFT_790874 [Xylariomycetidae sp. FL0641]|nr:hypothetical protein F4780DRAFT_790874 [Xylariomycetidae sp. FL0641]
MSSKRKADDFIYTLSDNEDIPDEEPPEPSPPKKKTKKSKKKATPQDEEDDGLWGKKADDDGAMDSDFEFAEDGTTDFRAEDFEGWGFDGARKGMNGAAEKKIVDVDEIVRRRKGKQGEEVSEPVKNDTEEPEQEDEEEEIDLDDEDDEVLAADGFGMGAASDEESADEEEGNSENGEDEDAEEDEENEDAASDNDSVASPVDHPDDQSDATDDEEDKEEAAKRAAFFAPEEKEQKHTGKKDGKKGSFQGMSLSRPILRGLNAVGFNTPTPIQAKTIPLALEGKDLVGGAVTGSGKTAAFVVPIIERLLYRPNRIPTSRVVILAPTRELAIQCHSVATKLASHTDIKFTLAVGGLSLKMQEAELRLRPDVIIATPGRFIDHMRNSASFNTDTIEILVLDEADRMLEDGFADELNEILTTLPKSRQTMLFSATMTSSVDRLIRAGLNRPVRVMVDSQRKTVDKLEQKFVRLRPGREDKRMGYLLHICKTMHTERVIIFFRQKKEAHRARIIFALLDLKCAELHGSMNQTQRISSVESFRDGKVNYLLATDLASRGLDIKGVDTVINYEGPQSLEIYVHRVGRTARAGRSGVAVTLAAEPDRKVVKAAVKAGKAQGAKISSLVIEPSEADKWQNKVDEMEDEIEAIAHEEKEEKQLANAEMQIKKGENMVVHEDEIKSRPKRTWFETQNDKRRAKEAGRAELNGLKESLKKKGQGKLSNKDKKKLDARSTRTEGTWKKGAAERSGKGAVLNFKGDKKAKKNGKTKSRYSRLGTSIMMSSLPPSPFPRKLGRSHNLECPVANTSSALSPTKLAPPRRFLSPRPHPHLRHRQSLLQYLFPRLRENYRERLLRFHETLPGFKHRVQSRIYRYILERQRRRREQSRLVDHARRLLLGRPAPQSPKHGRTAHTAKMTSMPGYGVGSGNYGADSGRERGARRRKLAAMAGSMYRAGAVAVNEIKESYNQTRVGEMDSSEASKITIPGSFPDVAIITKGNEQMLLFPSYAKQHVKGQQREYETPGGPPPTAAMGMDEQEYWRSEWARHEDEKAVVDVDVRGWIYNPHRGPMTRRNRVLVGLARQLSGIPPPRPQQAEASSRADPSLASLHQQHEEERERQSIAREAQEIERRGQAEKEAAQQGGYSEPPKDEDSEDEGDRRLHPIRSQRESPSSRTPSPRPPPRTNTGGATGMSEAELAIANANLMARIGPFMTTPLVEIPITLFFYNDTQSQSRTVNTDDSGHFNIRAALDFIPTHVRVLVTEDISCTNPVRIIGPKGVSLISDIDDTIKRSNIALGTKEIFRNTFVRELHDLTVPGVREWYNKLHDMGVEIHYCSNSPWQLYPVLATFFKLAGLPSGSLHLKRYTGMLQGIFEPVAERKKGTLERIMKDFPDRKFLLVGDSGEADLEVYTELAVAYPGRIAAIFIRDVTTPEQAGYFDSAYPANAPAIQLERPSMDDPRRRPSLPPRVRTEEPDLIDLSEKPEPIRRVESDSLAASQLAGVHPPDASSTQLPIRKPPPRPAKPTALQGSPSPPPATNGAKKPPPPPPPQPRRSIPSVGGPHPLSQTQNASQSQPQLTRANRSTPSDPSSSGCSSVSGSYTTKGQPPPPPPPRRRATPSSSDLRSQGPARRGSNWDLEAENVNLNATSRPGVGRTTPNAEGPPNKKLELWRRRLERAQDVLDQHGVPLYTWRRGEDVVREAVGIVADRMRELGVRR